MLPTPPPSGTARPVVDSGRAGGPAKLWLPPRGITGTRIRSLVRLPRGRRVVVAVLAALTGLAAAVVGSDSAYPEFAPLVVVVGLALALVLQQIWLRRIRRAHGFVQVTPLQFDLACALGELPAARIDEGRYLYDALVWHLQQPRPDTAAVAAIEQHMQGLVATAWMVAA